VLLEHALREIAAADYRGPAILPWAERVVSPPAEARALSAAGKHVVVFSPNRYSLYTLAVIQLLLTAGVQIDGVVVRKLLNPMRMLTEFRRDGKRLLKKIWNKLVLKRRAYAPAEFPQWPDLLKRLHVAERTVEALAAKHKIPIVYCSTLNDEPVHRALDAYRPDLAIFTGGGIIGEETLSRAGAGVVNCHMGQLPPYRGMDVVEWPILEQHLESLGFTVHFMDRGIDTGDILGIFPVDTSQARTVLELRTKFEHPMALSLVDTAVGFLNGEVQRQPQRLPDGKQYFIVHPRLYGLVRERYAQHVGAGSASPAESSR